MEPLVETFVLLSVMIPGSFSILQSPLHKNITEDLIRRFNIVTMVQILPSFIFKLLANSSSSAVSSRFNFCTSSDKETIRSTEIV